MATFDEWKVAFRDYSARRRSALEVSIFEARLMNLESEHRVAALRTRFEDDVAASFTRCLASGLPPGEAAAESLANIVGASRASGAFQFAISSSFKTLGMVTFASASDVAQRGGLGDIDPDDPPARIPVPGGSAFAGSRKPMVWVSPDIRSDDPTIVALELGLPHLEGHIVYMFDLSTDGLTAYVPTCFDAGLYEAWQIADPADARVCGRTRHVETGRREHREFILATASTAGRFGPAIRLPPTAGISRVRSMNPDYLVGRKIS